MDCRTIAWAPAGVAALCSAIAVVAILELLSGPATTTAHFAPVRVTRQPLVHAQPAGWKPAVGEQAPVTQAHSYDAPVAQDNVQLAAEVTPAGLPLAALLAWPALTAAVAYAFGRWGARRPAEAVALAAVTGEEAVPRRSLLSTAVVAASALVATPALAAVPSGFAFYKDPYDGYEFLYPFGWQQLQVEGQDVLFKDIIEPLETIGVTVTPTSRSSISDFGDAATVCFTVADKVLTSPNQDVTILNTSSEVSEGVTYYTVEFLASSSNFSRHALAALAVCNGKFYTCLTGSSEKRWKTMQDRLWTSIDAFTVFKVSSGTM